MEKPVASRAAEASVAAGAGEAAPPGTEGSLVDGVTDPLLFRGVLGQFPTGVTVVTANTPEGPVGLAVGSFTSVSLEPPLVGFLPAQTSSSWPLIEEAGAFCVNVLAEDQQEIARAFATPAADRFGDRAWTAAPHSGAPILDGVLAWIDCDVAGVSDAGDHHFVLGRVRALGAATDGAPLVFFQGRYRSLS
ncbi:MAG TPA: flavin reductase family protein [Mycobacteriales bacterium]|nr:flavin reductase family protein [Mycobacteriales bacterium]